MAIDISKLSQGDLIAFSKDMIEGDKHFSTEAWAFPDTLRNSLITAAENYENLYLAQNLSEGEKEKLMRSKNDHFKNKLIPTLRRVVHYIKATADDPENVLNGYGYDPGDFPTAQGDILALGENFIKGDDNSQGQPWQLTPELRHQLEEAVNEGISLYEQCVIAFGNQQETTQTQNEARSVLEKVLAKNKIQSDRTPWCDDINRIREGFWTESQPQMMSDALPIRPQRVINSVNERLKEPSIVISDAGTPTPYITRFLRLRGKDSRFIIPRSFGGLGYAIPAVIGAHLARPDTLIIGMFGDGSLGMSAGELETLARLNIPAKLIHFNNGSFGWIKALQSIHSGGRYQSVDFTQGDMARVASAFGLKSFHVKDPKTLDRVLDQALAFDGPVFIDVVSQPECEELPPVYSWTK